MIVERPRDLLIKKILAHGFLILFICLIMFPFLVVLSISFREGNFTTGSLLPDRPTLEHWFLAFGIPFTRADGTVVQPPYPVMLWMFNSVKIALIASDRHRHHLDDLGLRLQPGEVSAAAAGCSTRCSSSRCSRRRWRSSRSTRSSTASAR